MGVVTVSSNQVLGGPSPVLNDLGVVVGLSVRSSVCGRATRAREEKRGDKN